MGGYTKMIERMLEGIEVRLGVDFLKHRDEYETSQIQLSIQVLLMSILITLKVYWNIVVFTLKTERLEEENHQGVAVVNYTEGDIPYTRIIEHKHFEFGTQPVTYVTKEYQKTGRIGEEAYYPVNDVKNFRSLRKNMLKG